MNIIRSLALILLIPTLAIVLIAFDRILPIKNVTLDLRSGEAELWSFDLVRSCDVGIHNTIKDSRGVLFVEEVKYLSSENLLALYPTLKDIKIPKPNHAPHKGRFIIVTELYFYCNPIQTFFPVKFRMERGYIV